MCHTLRILVINPGSTSTKVAVFDNEHVIFEETLRHSTEEINRYDSILDQYTFRKSAVCDALVARGIEESSLSAVVGRGGFLKPMEGGTYALNSTLLESLKEGAINKGHASNLAGIIAHDLASEINIPAFIVDPPCVDEMHDVAKISGLDGIERESLFHALNQKAVARTVAEKKGRSYESCNFIVAHIGGGISVGAHRHGRVIDVNNALDGDGPFSPERAGGIPNCDLIEMCFSGKYSRSEVKKMIVGKGGFVSYLHVNDTRKVLEMIKNGDAKAKLIFKAMAYQVAKEIGACATVLEGNIDSIILTGGIAYSKEFSDMVEKQVGFLSEFIVLPGEDELKALAQGALRVLKGQEQAKVFQ